MHSGDAEGPVRSEKDGNEWQRDVRGDAWLEGKSRSRSGFTRKRTFSGFKSVWIMEQSVCRYSKARRICFTMILTREMGRPVLNKRTMLNRLHPRISNTMHTSIRGPTKEGALDQYGSRKTQ